MTYIQPYAWRCKWVELQIRKLLSQALKYDMQLAAHKQGKQLKSKDITVVNLDGKSLALPTHAQREKVMKRKKRMRVEDTIHKAAYMAQHNLFSYFGILLFSFLKSNASSCYYCLAPKRDSVSFFSLLFCFEIWMLVIWQGMGGPVPMFLLYMLIAKILVSCVNLFLFLICCLWGFLKYRRTMRRCQKKQLVIYLWP